MGLKVLGTYKVKLVEGTDRVIEFDGDCPNIEDIKLAIEENNLPLIKLELDNIDIHVTSSEVHTFNGVYYLTFVQKVAITENEFEPTALPTIWQFNVCDIFDTVLMGDAHLEDLVLLYVEDTDRWCFLPFMSLV